VDHRSYGPVVRFRFRVGAWNNAALVDFARYALRTEVITSPVGLVPTNAFVGSSESTNLPPVIA
jgi:hypothetical protein